MGTFNVEIGIGHRDREEWETLDALVDPDAFITAAPCVAVARTRRRETMVAINHAC